MLNPLSRKRSTCAGRNVKTLDITALENWLWDAACSTAEGDKLLLNGTPPDKDFINQTWSQTYQLKSYLKEQTGKEYQVKPVLCFSKAFVQLRQAVKGVAVVNLKFLNELLQRQKPQLLPEDIRAITLIFKEKTSSK